MRGKRFLSLALSAVLGASSASGLALLQEKQAFAADFTYIDYIGTHTAPETFDSYTASGGTWDTAISALGNASGFGYSTVTYVAPPEVGSEISSGYPTYADGTALTVRRRGGKLYDGNTTAAKYTMTDARSNGKIFLKTAIGMSCGGTYRGGSVYLFDSAGNAVLTISMPDSGDSNYSIIGTTTANSKKKISTRKTNKDGIYVEAELDLDKDTAKVMLDYVAADNIRYQDNLTVNISDTDIAGLAMASLSAGSSNNDTMIDNTQFYAQYIENHAQAINISYTAYDFDSWDGEGAIPNKEVASKTIDISEQNLQAGDSADYYIPAFVIGNDDELYLGGWEADGDGHNVLRKTQSELLAGTTAKEIGVANVNDGEYYKYVEFDGEDVLDGNNQYASNGSVQTIGAGDKELLEVDEDGMYEIWLVTALTNATAAPTAEPEESEEPAASADATLAPYETDETAEPDSGDYCDTKKGAVLKTDKFVIDGGDGGAYINDMYSNGGIDFYNIPTFCVYDDVPLTRGSKLILTGYGANSAIDYILILKTGSYKAPEASYGSYTRKMEKLDRGVFATYTGSGVYLSWRLLGTESLTDQAFDIYRNGTLIYTTGAHDATNYTDPDGTSTSQYIVVPTGNSTSGETAVTSKGTYVNFKMNNSSLARNYNSYFDINISQPAWREVEPLSDSASEGTAADGDVPKSDGESGIVKDDGDTSSEEPSGEYTANDASVGDRR